MFYLYIKALTTPGFRIEWAQAVHLLPLLIFSINLNGDNSDAYKGRLGVAYIQTFYYVLLVAYCIAAARLMPNYGRYIKSRFSSIDRISLAWLYKLIIVYLISSLLFLILRIVELYALISDANLELFYVNNTLVMVVCFYLIALGGYRQDSTSFDTNHHSEDEEAKSASESVKIKQIPFSDETSDAIWQQLNTYMNSQEPFLNEELSLTQLAEGVGISPRDLGQVINTVSGKNFYDFVNGYRAEKARELLESEDRADTPMVDIGIESGFASKVTFYKYFKRHFSQTPLQYRKTRCSQ